MRIYEDTPPRNPKEWCWHRSWLTGHDSAYALLMKFAFLNALTARELAQLFASRERGKRTQLLRTLHFDLRNSENFDLAAMARAFGTDMKTVEGAFLDRRFTNPLASDGDLKWCEECLAYGMHFPGLQMDSITRCPHHNVLLRKTCLECEQAIPYTFAPANFNKPFCCPNCQAEMGSHLKVARSKLPALPPESATNIERMNRFIEAYSARVERQPAFPHPDMLTLPCAEPGETGAFRVFVELVVEALRTTNSRHRANDGLIVAKCGCGGRRPYEQMHEHFKLVDDAAFPFGAEAELTVAIQVYRALRRRHWIALRNHRECVRSACRHLWWDMRGQRTTSFCAKAGTYIRWRMLWEGCGSPRYLQARRKTPYFGILGWLQARPAPYPDAWEDDQKAWMLSHIFASVCLASYDAIDRAAEETRESMCWSTAAEAPFATTHWALRDGEAGIPTTLFLPARRPKGTDDASATSSAQHHAWHCARVRQIAESKAKHPTTRADAIITNNRFEVRPT
ncbi:hypothetical protein [Herbaspirillum sp. SJZ107]|uniref:hypothetical protein n=2 Tax=Oxalobacteraceae TaxID=75682 RepID=UPI0011678DB3|nr:hypothetical protein [Herbaspirillum sp. SJZ107]TQK01206.1 hypothetical protein FBX97_5731 [Herbaspirillum sp. SJZ107]